MATTPTTDAPATPLLEGVPRDLLFSTIFLLKRLGMAVKERSHEAFEGTGLTGQHYAVHVDEGMPGVLASVVGGLPADLQAGLHNIMICDTTVVLCDENGSPPSLDVFHRSAPGAPHRIALQELGFDVVEEA